MTARKLKILIIEDNPGDALLLESYLEESYFYYYKTESAETLEAGLEKLHEQAFDIVTLDLGLPDAVGLEGVERILNEHSHLCLIVVTGNENKALGVDAIKLGAQDYLNKNALAPDNLDKSLAFAYDRLKAQQQLVQQQNAYELAIAQYHLLAENSLDLIMVADIDFNINYISPTVESIMGYTVEEYSQKRLKDVIVEEDLPAAKQVIEDFRSGDKASLLELRFLTGTSNKPRWFEAKVERKIGLEADKDVFVIRLRDIHKRKEAELSLLESQQRLDMAIKGTNAGTWDWRIREGLTIFNDRWAEIIGYSLEELDPVSIETWENFTHPDDLMVSNANLEEHFRGETEFYDCRVRMQHKQGHWVWIWDRGRVVERGENGEPLRMIGTHVDITEQMEAELRLRESEENYRFLAESLPVMIFKINDSFEIEYMNRAAFQYTGLEKIPDSPQDWAKQVHPEDFSVSYEKTSTAIKDKVISSYEQRVFNKDGIYRWVSMSLYPFEDAKSGRVLILGMGRDIHDEKLARQALIDSEENYRFLAENLPLMLMKLNSNFELTYMNHVGLEFAGHESIPKDTSAWAKQIHPEDAKKVPGYLEQCLKEKTNISYDQRIKNIKGEFRWFTITVYPYQNPGEEDVSLLAIARDVHDEKIAQEALLQSEADFRRGFEVAKIGRWKYKIQEDQFVWTDDARKVIGVPANKNISTLSQFRQYWHPEDREAVERNFRDSWGKGHFFIEHRYLHTDKRITWVRVIADIEYDQNQNPLKAEGIVQDITQEKELLESIAQSEADLKRGFELAKIGRWQYNITENRFSFSDDAIKVLQLSSPTEIVTHEDMAARIHPDDRENAITAIKGVHKTRQFLLDHRFLLKNGDFIWTRITGDLVQNGHNQPSIVIGVVQDVTEEKRLFEKINTSNERFKKTLENITEGYVIFEKGGNIIELNKAGRKLLNITRGLTKYNIQDFWVDSLGHETLMASIQEKTQLLNQDLEIRDAKGYNAIFRFNFQRSALSDGEDLYEASFHDVSEDFYVKRLNETTAALYNYSEQHSSKELLQFGVEQKAAFSNSSIAFFHLINDAEDGVRESCWSTNTSAFVVETLPSKSNFKKDLSLWRIAIDQKGAVIDNSLKGCITDAGLYGKYLCLDNYISLPILEGDKIVAVIGVANKPYEYTQVDVNILEAFGAGFWSILKRKEFEERILVQKHYIEESERQYVNLVNNVDGVVYKGRFNDEFYPLFISEGCIELTGYTPEEFRAKPSLIMDIVHPNDQEEVIRATKEALQKRSEFEMSFRIYDKKGKIKWLSDRGKVVFDNTLDGYVLQGIISDISDSVNNQESILNEIMNAELRERSRISKELHDGLQQTLSATFHSMESLKKGIAQLDDAMQKRYTRGKELLQRSIQESRDIAHRLLPKVIEDNGLYVAMQALVDGLKGPELTISYHHNLEANIDLDKQIELTIYRIAQESLTNVLKYAKAKHVDMQLLLYEDEIMLTLEDDGVGFNAQKVTDGYGLMSMKNRAAAVGGFVQIDSRAGKGTNVLLTIPINLASTD